MPFCRGIDRVRRRFARGRRWRPRDAVAALVFACQLLGVLLPVVAQARAAGEPTGADEFCTCEGMEDGTCPMRHAPGRDHGTREPSRVPSGEQSSDPSGGLRWCAGCGDPVAGLAGLFRSDAPPEDRWVPRVPAGAHLTSVLTGPAAGVSLFNT
jgi:hypothetical protein